MNRGTRSHFSHVSVTHKPRETQREGRGHAIITESAKVLPFLEASFWGLDGWTIPALLLYTDILGEIVSIISPAP